MGLRFLNTLGGFMKDNRPILLPGVVGFVFLLGAIQIYRTGKTLYAIVFLACALCLFYFSWYHYTKKGTRYYGQTITSHESWEDMPWWKRLPLLVFVILFLLLWGYLFVIWIMRGGVPFEHIPFENICLGNC